VGEDQQVVARSQAVLMVRAHLDAGGKEVAVTLRPPDRTVVGQRNLNNLIGLGLEQFDCTINPKVDAKLMLRGFERFGSTAIPMHLALFGIPLTMAVRMKIPLVICGENSAFEYGNVEEVHTGFALDRTLMALPKVRARLIGSVTTRPRMILRLMRALG
jgi:hypothetical protein